MDQAKAAAQMGRRIQRSLMKTEMKAAMSRGKIQYPRTQRDWKKLLLICGRLVIAFCDQEETERKGGHFAAEQLGIERYDDRAEPYDDEYTGEDLERLLGGCYRWCCTSVAVKQMAAASRTIRREQDSEGEAELWA